MVEALTLTGLAAAGLARSAGRAALDEAAFTLLYERTARPLRAYLRRICNDPATADDLLQEVYLRYCRVRPAEVSEPETRSYLFRIATNLATDHWRRRATRPRTVPLADPESEPGAAQASPGDEESARIARRDVEKAFARLSPRERAMIWLAYFEGCDHREIALRIGSGPGSVRVLLFRARRKLARLLGPGQGGQEAER
jgi:RNA polymerase sigma-70 factor (ECF subfamily)